MRELREAVVSEQEAKLWAYRTLEEHRVEQETYAAIKVAREAGRLKAAFIESKVRVYDYWQHKLRADNDILRAVLAAHGVALPPPAPAPAAPPAAKGDAGAPGISESGTDVAGVGEARLERPPTPPEFLVREDPARRHGGCSRAPSALSAELSVDGGTALTRSLASDTSSPARGARGEEHALTQWVRREASKVVSASLDVVRRNAPVERRTLLVRSSLDCMCVCVCTHTHTHTHTHK